jgi:hypothetical protein
MTGVPRNLWVAGPRKSLDEMLGFPEGTFEGAIERARQNTPSEYLKCPEKISKQVAGLYRLFDVPREYNPMILD